MTRGRPEIPEGAKAKSGSNVVRKDSPAGCALPRKALKVQPEQKKHIQVPAPGHTKNEAH